MLSLPPDESSSPASAVLRVGQRLLPLRAGDACGDAAACFELPAAADGTPRCLVAIIDGLGHGSEAALAAQAALATLAAAPELPLADLYTRLNARLLDTRGAAVGLARIDGLRLRHAGIGNTRALRLRGSTATRLPSCNGIVGGGLPLRVTVTELSLAPGDWLILFTDGLNEALQLPVQLPEWQRDPVTLCDHLLAHWRNPRDDAGVLAGLVAPTTPLP